MSGEAAAIVFLSLDRQTNFFWVVLLLQRSCTVNRRLPSSRLIQLGNQVIDLAEELAGPNYSLLVPITLDVSIIVVKLALADGADFV